LEGGSVQLTPPGAVVQVHVRLPLRLVDGGATAVAQQKPSSLYIQNSQKGLFHVALFVKSKVGGRAGRMSMRLQLTVLLLSWDERRRLLLLLLLLFLLLLLPLPAVS
jgi:hypothetical protein